MILNFFKNEQVLVFIFYLFIFHPSHIEN